MSFILGLNMVRELNMDTQRQNFWKESINKEANVRLLWHTRYSKEFAERSFAVKPQKKEGMVFKSKEQALGSKTVGKDEKKATGKAKKPGENKAAAAGTTAEPESLLIEMRPVSSDTRSLLYKGFSALGKGRYAYLQQRRLKKPEEKYEFPITSAWEIGWKINDCVKPVKPQFGQSREIRDSFYRSNGIFYTD